MNKFQSMIFSPLYLAPFFANATKKVGNNSLNWAVFSNANWPKTIPNLKFCSKKLAHVATYV